jgi:LPXTG-motif cell wall-anchored protein
MKKILFAAVMVMTMAFGANAQNDAFFEWNTAETEIFRTTGFESLLLPLSHGLETDVNAPLGSGLLILTALGAGYALKKKRKN